MLYSYKCQLVVTQNTDGDTASPQMALYCPAFCNTRQTHKVLSISQAKPFLDRFAGGETQLYNKSHLTSPYT